jgi:hypothetical protein
MRYKLFEEVVLTKDFPEKGLKKGDVATIVEHHPGHNGDDGYTLEIFNTLGDTIAIITVPQSAITALTKDTIFNIRSLVAA